MLRNRTYNLKNKVWFYLIIFSFLIFIFFWTFQTLFSNTYYEVNKKRELNTIARMLNNTDSILLTTEIDNLAYDYGVCIELFSNNTLIYSSNSLEKGCIEQKDLTFYQYKNKFISGDEEEGSASFYNSRFNNKTIVKAIKYNNYTIFINASLEPVGTTSLILSRQLAIVSIVVLVLSFLLSYFISENISKPIVKLNKKATEISKGNFDIENENISRIEEIEKLNSTLNTAAKELSQTETLRRELLANVSHDLKTPLTMIKAYAEMARDINYNNKKKREENLNIIVDEVDRLNLLVNDILELSKVQANTEKYVKEKIDIDDFVSNIVRKYDYLKEGGYEIVYNGIKNVTVNEDKKRLNQILDNLINNALKYTGKDKKVIVNIVDLKKKIRIEVVDSGKGIKEEELKYIWDKYYKIDKSYQRNTKSTGLGLSIVKNICVQNDIEYGVNSKENLGSTFWIELEKM